MAMVLAAGLGTRMREVTRDLPKPLVRVAGKTLLDHNLDFLKRSGFRRVVVNIAYMADKIEAHLQAREDLEIIFSREEAPLETGGGIKRALPLLGDEPFLVMNSDTVLLDGYEPALSRLAARFDPEHMDGALLVHPTARAYGYHGRGDFFVSATGALRRRNEREVAPFVFVGAQILHPRLFAGSPDGAFSMNLLYNRDRAPDGTLHRFCASVHDGEWLHVGDARGLGSAERVLSPRHL